MISPINSLVFLIGLIFSPIAALMAFFITYDEYLHHYPDNRMPRWIALQTAIGTFVLFLLMSLVIAWILGRVL
jgi:hypothetical protein